MVNQELKGQKKKKREKITPMDSKFIKSNDVLLHGAKGVMLAVSKEPKSYVNFFATSIFLPYSLLFSLS